jgi:hypothetical protein
MRPAHVYAHCECDVDLHVMPHGGAVREIVHVVTKWVCVRL